MEINRQEIVGSVEDSQETICKEKISCCCFNSLFKRFVVLFFIIVIVFLYAVNFDMPGSMENVVERTFSVASYEFEYLYSVYSLPNVIMCFFSGLLMDKALGLSWSFILFGMVALVGQVLITSGGFTRYYSLLLIGRFVSGMGLESVSLALCCYSVICFKAEELSFVFGLLTSVSRLGSSFAFFIFTPVYKYAESITSKESVFGLSLTLFLLISIAMEFTIIILSYFCTKNCKTDCNFKKLRVHLNLKDILDFPLIYWFVLIMLSVCNNAVFSFESISQELLTKKYDLTQDYANYLSSAFNIISALICPIPGLLVYKFGNEMYVNLFGMILGVISQIILAITNWTPLIPLILFSAFYAVLNSCSWPLVSRVVKPYQIATAYGTLQCFINIVGTVNNILAGYFLDWLGPGSVAVLFLGNIMVGGIFCLIIWIVGCKQNFNLNTKARLRKRN